VKFLNVTEHTHENVVFYAAVLTNHTFIKIIILIIFGEQV